jgi:hypothetical protein
LRSSSRLVAALVSFVSSSAALFIASTPSTARAFADASQFFKTAPNAATFGATSEGLYFTGAPRFASLDCSTCHTAGPQRVGLRLNADDLSLFTTGYQPGKTYELQVVLTNESEGTFFKTATCTDPPAPDDTFTYVQCNNNGFALEIDASDGPLAGSNVYCAQQPKAGMCPMPDFTADQTLVSPDGDAVFDAKIYSADPNQPKLITRNDAADWKFFWTAPKAGTGALTVYISAVDGNGGAGNATNDQDPYNDDTVAANFFLQESGAPVNNSAAAGCAIGSPSASSMPSASALWLLAAALLLIRAAGGSAAARRGSRRDPPADRQRP